MTDLEKQELETLYQDFHQHPELGNQEYRTTERIEQELQKLGIETYHATETGVIGYMECARGADAVAFRADIDALPIEEESGVSYSSRTSGVMHACGHDFHTTALLGAARILAAKKEKLSRNLVFIFQPDEEGDGGAERILESGILEKLRVCAVFGAHINPSLPVGSIGIRYGRFYASACKFDVTVRGKGAHGAEPENGTDALYAGARMCTEIKELTGDYRGERAVATVGAFHGGNLRNIISDHADFLGIIRTDGAELRTEMEERLREIIKRVNRETGTTSDSKIVDGYVGVTNHHRETALVEETARHLLPPERVVIEEQSTMTTEDFGFYLERYPGCYYHIGVGSNYPLHNSKMCPDIAALPAAAQFHAAVAEAWMEQEN